MLLVVETSHRTLGTAVVRNGEVAAVFECREERPPHVMRLPEAVRTVLREVGCRMRDIRAIALDIGPGSFTGLRIGAGFVKGAAAGLDVPVVPVLSVDAIAEGIKPEKQDLWVLLDAKRSNVYAARYVCSEGCYRRDADVRLEPLEKLLPRIGGDDRVATDLDGAGRATLESVPHLRLLSAAQGEPAVGALSRVAWRHYFAGEQCAPADLSPLYLYPRDCSVGPEMKARIQRERGGSTAL